MTIILQYPFGFCRWVCFPFLQVSNVEKTARFPGWEKNVESCHVCGCHGFLLPNNKGSRAGILENRRTWENQKPSEVACKVKFSEPRLVQCTYHRGPKLLQKKTLQNNCFGAIHFVKITKQSLYKTKSLACPLTKSNKPVAVRLQRKSSGGISFVIITKIITEENVPGNYFVIISARMVVCALLIQPTSGLWPKPITNPL